MNALEFVDGIISSINDKLLEEPYQINLLEEVHLHDKDDDNNVKENAHSRIISKILQYKNREKKYVALELLLNSIGGSSWQNLASKIVNPKFTLESFCQTGDKQGRIDLLIRETGKYAIIVENKSNGAADLPRQLARYIEELKSRGYKPEDIFILYLSTRGTDPNGNSWGEYKKTFEPRFANYSFDVKIRNWINILITKIPQEEKYLLSALEQYKDFWDGKFGKREFNAKIETITSNVLRENLQEEILQGVDSNNYQFTNIDSDINETIAILEKKIYDCEIIAKNIDNANMNEANKEMITDLPNNLKNIKREILSSKIGLVTFTIHNSDRVFERQCHLGYIIRINKEDRYIAYIGEKNRFFCSVISKDKGRIINPEHKEKLREYLNCRGKDNDWMAKYFDKGDYASALITLRNVLNVFRGN